ncbi:MAG: zf-HC2 domain-containing protein [Candidatus Aminicenantes bacterium]|nr:zf-HC2 domain-containing protein [Candidatus Aminicenantes bacterium]
MTCLTIDRLYDYVDGVLSVAGKEAVERHLASCESCRHALAVRERIAGAAADLPAFEVPEDFAARVMEKASALPVLLPKKSKIWLIWPAAAATIAAGFGLFTILSGQGTVASLQKIGAAFGTYLQNAAAAAAKGLKLIVLGGKIIGDISGQALATLQSVADIVGPEAQIVLAGGTLIILFSGGMFLRRRYAVSERTHEK